MSFWIINFFTAILSFGIAAVSGKWLVPFLHKIKFGQPIKVKDGPEWHAKKQGTPTMGGFMFIISSVIMTITGYWAYRIQAGLDVTDSETHNAFYRLLSVLIFSLLFGLIGFIDDYTKVARKNNDGLSPIQKIALQTIFGLIFLFTLYKFGNGSTAIDLGFWESPQLGIFYY
ncbi:MAG: phospho-N-acetylmuramoyl-pentapeptide-transferase, partial [Ruminococcus sp.]|nr:phospho-N-acetylmuramoyl-pentapeptide-transferase [Ruminococcus sp.]